MSFILPKYFPLFFVALIFFQSHSLNAQYIYSNDHLSERINTAIDHIYNLEFDQSEKIINELEGTLHDHPSLLLLKAFNIYWKKKPFKVGTEDFAIFEGYLQKTLRISEEMLEENDEDIEANFFALASHAYLAQMYVDNGENLKALSEAKSCYSYIKDGFDYIDEYPEYYFPCGIYNYYREKYPEENPFFKPFLWFFRSGDKEEGIRMLKIGGRKALFTKVENYVYLFHIYLRYEEKPDQASVYAKKLIQMYPNNNTFVANYAESLIFEDKYQQAKPYIDQLTSSDSDYFRYVGYGFLGYYYEEVEKDLDQALKAYKVSDEYGNKLDIRTLHMDSQLYYGMGRVYDKMGDKEEATEYLKLSIKKAEYSLTRDQAKRYLNSM